MRLPCSAAWHSVTACVEPRLRVSLLSYYSGNLCPGRSRSGECATSTRWNCTSGGIRSPPTIATQRHVHCTPRGALGHEPERKTPLPNERMCRVGSPAHLTLPSLAPSPPRVTLPFRRGPAQQGDCRGRHHHRDPSHGGRRCCWLRLHPPRSARPHHRLGPEPLRGVQAPLLQDLVCSCSLCVRTRVFLRLSSCINASVYTCAYASRNALVKAAWRVLYFVI